MTEVRKLFAPVLDQIVDAVHHQVKLASVHTTTLRTLTTATAPSGTPRWALAAGHPMAPKRDDDGMRRGRGRALGAS